jgi:cytochrome P450
MALAVPRVPSRESMRGLIRARHDMVGFLEDELAKHGDIFRLYLGGFPMIFINHPDFIHRVLVENHANYDKENFLYRAIRPILRGALTGNPGGPDWQRRRRTMQPSFHAAAMAGLIGHMSSLASEMLSRWEKAAAEHMPVDVSADTATLSLHIVTRSLFGVDIGTKADAFEREFLEVNAIAGDFLRFPFPPLSWPTPRRNRLRTLIAALDGFVVELVRSRRMNATVGRGDLFDALASAVDKETGVGLSAEELAQEILGMIIAGYETSSHALAWVCYQLAAHPDAQRAVQEEVDRVLAGRPPVGFAPLVTLHPRGGIQLMMAPR